MADYLKGYTMPQTAEGRRAGMAALRRQLLAAHMRQAQNVNLTPKQRREQQGAAEFTRRIQTEKGEA